MNKLLTLILGLSILSFSLQAQVQTIDGSNNNLDHPDWGATQTQLITPEGLTYSDGVSEPTGISRSAPRDISNVIFSQSIETDIPSPMNLSDFCWSFGQLIDHDVVLVGENDEHIMINVPKCDEFFDPLCSGTAIMPIRRTIYDATTGSDSENPRQFLNEVTHWVDASFLYGSTIERNTWIRSFEDGKLKTSSGNYLPLNTLSGEFNSPVDVNAPEMAFVSYQPGIQKYYVAGDVRANENVMLTSLHTIWLREHNRLADSISAEFPLMEDEAVFQKTRRLVIGLMQHFVFDEWLPEIGIFLPTYTGYDASVNPSITNAFSVATFRIGHTIVGDVFWRLNERGDTIPQGHVFLKDAYFNSPFIFSEAGIDPLLRGAAAHRQQAFDPKLVDGLRNRLFGDPGTGGLDLVSINIMRGRERGLPDYNTIRKAYGLKSLEKYNKISSNPAYQNQLKEVYWDINDIDPWVGMLVEDRMPNKMMGETMHTILSRQFQRLRDSDRFFYLNDSELSQTEIDWIQSNMLSDLIMRNSGVELMQRELIVAMPRDEIIKEKVDMPKDELASYTLPNPIQKDGQLNVIVASPIETKGDIDILDFSGKKILSQQISLNQGKSVFNFDLSSYPAGIYLVKIVSGSQQTIERVVK